MILHDPSTALDVGFCRSFDSLLGGDWNIGLVWGNDG